MTIVSSGSSRIFIDTVDPTASFAQEDGTGPDQGNFWFNSSSGQFFLCSDNTMNQEVWNRLTFQISPTLFTPSVIGDSTSGTATYSIQKGAYLIVGPLTLVNIQLTWTGHTGTGNMLIAGLPSQPNVNSVQEVPIYLENIAWPAGSSMTFARSRTDTNLDLVASGAGIAASAISMSAAGSIKLGMAYF